MAIRKDAPKMPCACADSFFLVGVSAARMSSSINARRNFNVAGNLATSVGAAMAETLAGQARNIEQTCGIDPLVLRGNLYDERTLGDLLREMSAITVRKDEDARKLVDILDLIVGTLRSGVVRCANIKPRKM